MDKEEKKQIEEYCGAMSKAQFQTIKKMIKQLMRMVAEIKVVKKK